MPINVKCKPDNPKCNCICKQVSSHAVASVSNMYLDCVVNIEAMEIIKINVPVSAKAVCIGQSVKKPEISQKPSLVKEKDSSSGSSSSDSDAEEESVRPKEESKTTSETIVNANKVTTTTLQLKRLLLLLVLEVH